MAQSVSPFVLKPRATGENAAASFNSDVAVGGDSIWRSSAFVSPPRQGKPKAFYGPSPAALRHALREGKLRAKDMGETIAKCVALLSGPEFPAAEQRLQVDFLVTVLLSCYCE